jgi:5-methylcytosine-specific restriction endonuclease McrA
MRRYSPIAKSRGTVIPPAVRLRVLNRDQGCVGFQLLPGECAGPLELDHVRASHGMGMKSETVESNLVALCNSHHLWRTTHGREGRPILLSYLEKATA